MIRAVEDELRARAANAIQQFVRELSAPDQGNSAIPTPGDMFHRVVSPFLRDVWPQERSVTTPGVSKALADLPAATREAFAPAVKAIQRFLMPFDAWSLSDYGLFGDAEGEPKIAIVDNREKAVALLLLLDSTIGTTESAVIPYDLGTGLTQVEKIAPDLAQNPTFRRLATAARR
jgi:hypothetical protein